MEVAVIPCTGWHYPNGYASRRVGLLVNLFDRDKYSPGWASQHSDFETECVRLRFRRIGYQWIGTASRSKNCVGCFLGALLSPAPEWHDPLLAGR